MTSDGNAGGGPAPPQHPPLPHHHKSDLEDTRERFKAAMTFIIANYKGGEDIEALRAQRELPPGRFSRVYAYWMFTLFAVRGRPFPFIPMVIFLIYCCGVTAFGLYYMDVNGDLEELYKFKPEMKDVTQFMGLAVFLLLSFRNNSAYQRWYDGATRFQSLCSLMNDAARQIAAITPTEQAVDLLYYLMAALYFAKQQLRNNEKNKKEVEVIETALPKRIWNSIAGHDDKFHWCMYNYHHIAVRINYGITTEDRGCQEVMRISIPMIAAYGACYRILKTPMPFAYLTHLRAFMAIWLAILPWMFVISYGWYGLIFCGFISYAVLGVEESATEIEQPFGNDVNDLPLDRIAQPTFKLISTFLYHVGFDEEGNSLVSPIGEKLC